MRHIISDHQCARALAHCGSHLARRMRFRQQRSDALADGPSSGDSAIIQ
jgi:hypothetical protein